MTTKEMTLLSLIGFGIWLSGAVTFRLGGGLMLESGAPLAVLSAVGIAVSVCVLLRTIMDWRRTPASQSVAAAVVMITPGLFGDVVYTLNFARITGLQPATAPVYAAVMLFGTAVLLAYAMVRARPVAA